MLSFIINVPPRTKKNSSQVIHHGGRSFVVPSKHYQKFEKDCLKSIPSSYRNGINTPVNIKALFYVDSRRRVDLTNLLNALDDMLVKANVIEDDNCKIAAGHDGSRVYYDKEEPRIEVFISEIPYEFES